MLPPWMPRYGSTRQYLFWACLYAALGLLRGPWTTPVLRFFGIMVGVDVILNFWGVFLIPASLFVWAFFEGVVEAVARSKPREVPWVRGLIAISVPLGLLLLLGWMVAESLGWIALAFVLLFYAKLNWYAIHKEQGLGVPLLLAARGLAGIFVFFVPALIISSWYVGRNSLSSHRPDWVPLFGVIYFTLQAVWEEVVLRWIARSEQKKADGAAE